MGTQREAIHCKLRGINDSFIKETAFELSFGGRVNRSEIVEEREGHPSLRRQAKL